MKITMSVIALLCVGCQGIGEHEMASLSPHSEIQDEQQIDWATPDQDTDHEVAQSPPPSSSKICSKLNFSGLDWAAGIPSAHREALSLALNISGSFEGDHGWKNITGNFDGQGISFGLLNQNFGQGSLQPMWIKMYNRYRSQFAAQFNSTMLASMKTMLDRWNSYARSATLKMEDYGYNELDDPYLVAEDLGVPVEEIINVSSNLLQKNQESVNWAKKTFLSGSNIKSQWRTPLSNLAGSQGYRSIQVEQAQELHDEALVLVKQYKTTQLRAYLLFFDFVVQNGGIPATVFTKYSTWLRSNPSANEYNRLKKIIELRVALSNPKWQKDVRLRKNSILEGKGTVHGIKRDYNREYCANLGSSISF